MSVPVHKIAVASRDGKLVYHFGQADRFLIYEIDSAGSRYLETRATIPACSDGPKEIGHEQRIAGTADIISDCRAVLVSRIGPGAEAVLHTKGIQAIEVTIFVEDAIKQYLSILQAGGAGA